MIDNLMGLARTFERMRSSAEITHTAESLVHMDMGAAAAQRHMPQWYHDIVNAAKAWLRTQDAALA